MAAMLIIVGCGQGSGTDTASTGQVESGVPGDSSGVSTCRLLDATEIASITGGDAKTLKGILVDDNVPGMKYRGGKPCQWFDPANAIFITTAEYPSLEHFDDVCASRTIVPIGDGACIVDREKIWVSVGGHSVNIYAITAESTVQALATAAVQNF